MRSAAVSLLLAMSSQAWADPVLDLPVLQSDPQSLMLDVLEGRAYGESFELAGVDRADGALGIVNGTEVGAYDYENVVALAALPQFGGNGGFIFCSGSLIDPDWVLTAAHCVIDMDYLFDYGYGLYILFGGDIINDGYTDAIEWESYEPHPQYDAQNFLNDIGLIELRTSKLGVDFVVLNDEAVSAAWYGDDLTILGYGITTDGAYNAGTKRVTEIPIVDHDSQYTYTYDPNTNVCQGDSGGPAFEVTPAGDLEQVGVNAFVTPGCEGGSAGLTRVDVYVPWILGYVPNVLLSGSGEGSGGEEPTEPTDPGGTTGDGGGGGGGGDPEPVDELDPDAIDRDLDDAPRPDGGFPIGVRCDSAGGMGGAGPLVGILLFALASRRRMRSRTV